MKRAVVVTEVISPYRIPLFNEIAKCEEIRFQVFFLAETVRGRLWRTPKEEIRFAHRVFSGIPMSLPNRFPIFYNPLLGSALKREDPDVVISGGYHHLSSLVALHYARKYGKRFVLWCESHERSIGLKAFPFNLYRRYFVHSSQGFLVPGKKSFDFIQSFGTNGKNIWVAPNAVDNVFFMREAERLRSQMDPRRRDPRFSSHVILYVGRIVESKGILVLLEAFRDLSKRMKASLVLVGEGQDRAKYSKLCAQNGLKNVFFEGFKQREELPFYYGLASLLVLPSHRDEWGLVLNEAAASGLPLVATEGSGAAFDLIEEGKNGFRIPVGDSRALKERMVQILSNPGLQKSMGAYSEKKARAFSPQRCAAGFIRAILNQEEER